MDQVTIDLQNCYGIKALRITLDFRNTPVYAIYAPNGVMKSSLAQTFKDAANGKSSEDRIFPTRKTYRKIADEADKEIDGERVLVVGPYDEQFGPTEKTATLLVDAKLKKEYDALHVAIDETKEAFLKAIRKQANSRLNFEEKISSAFTASANKFDDAVARIKKEVQNQKETPFANVEYDVIFNDQVMTALGNKDIKGAVEDYVRRYNELLDASTFFKKGTFDYYNAAQIAKHLADNGFFEAKHTVTLKATGKSQEINTQKELEDIIAQEKAAMMADKDLRKKFDAVAKQLEKNAAVRDFCRYLQFNEPLLSRMNNLDQFKEDVLKSYIKANEPLYLEMMKTYESAEKRIKEIEAEAQKQRTQWEHVIAIFNDRFVVPFKLEARNRTAVMLGYEPIVDLGFTYWDGKDNAPVEKPKLLQVLSTGERKALYILNVIFEVERRRKDGLETLLLVDDIADSFDYQNKYAIIHYLKEISENGLFKLIIMTHNFDFFRTLEGRFVRYPYCLMASKNPNGITLAKATGIRNIFANDWKTHFFDDPKKKIASIPFLRNLIEMTTGESDPRYCQLTSMLHWKSDTPTMNIAKLDEVYNTICGTSGTSADPAKVIYDLIVEQANACLGIAAGLNLENKIVLAIAIRMIAEKFMVTKIADAKFVAGITANQTQVLIDRFKTQFSNDAASIRVLDQVALMTPENIHVNAFMYEPIVDMSDDHLKRLYQEAAKLA
ncbi:hypothetical protein DNFV4_01805 [Nitrospira tepida]|uniref:Phage infection protein n=1 Tax=Nitrospira tepida TaxID=2973512 RepID=A0AA86MYG8_9BACT|nr:hypothetical protein [Nitrospira tepida]CAI4031379.1 hypothetical protein DNFV4_01805 [Nitrospira tepida]